jgi:hypothetical protein
MAEEAILVNNRTYDFGACRLEVFGLKRVGFTKADYDDSMEFGEGRGASQVALGTGKGKYKAEPFKITLHKSSAEELRQHIAAQSRTGKSLSSVRGTIVLQVVDDELGVQTVTAKGCRVMKGGTSSNAEGAEALMEDWEFYVRLLDRNGVTLYESDEAGV